MLALAVSLTIFLTKEESATPRRNTAMWLRAHIFPMRMIHYKKRVRERFEAPVPANRANEERQQTQSIDSEHLHPDRVVHSNLKVSRGVSKQTAGPDKNRASKCFEASDTCGRRGDEEVR